MNSPLQFYREPRLTGAAGVASPARGSSAPSRILRTARVACLMALLAGCGSKPAPSSNSAGAGASKTLAESGSLEAKDAVQAPIPRSVFHAGKDAGRDPFFSSTTAVAEANPDQPAPVRLPIVGYLKLLGIRSGTSRPMALINRTSLAPGENADISIVISNQFSKAEVQKVNVRCLEVRRDSVLISIAGEQGVKELRVAQVK